MKSKLKVSKKILIFVLVGFFVSSSIVVTYEKAYCSYAVALPVAGELCKDAVIVLLMALGITCVGGVVLDENSTDAEWEEAYETDKEAYEQLQKYYTDQSDYANAQITTVSGQTVALADAIKDDYVSLDKYKDLRKNNPNPTKVPGIDWDSVVFGADLLELLADFYNNKTEPTNCLGEKWLCYTGDSGYFENGKLNILLRYGFVWDLPEDGDEVVVLPYCWNFKEDMIRDSTTNFDDCKIYRAAVLLSEPTFSTSQGWRSLINIYVSGVTDTGNITPRFCINNCTTERIRN